MVQATTEQRTTVYHQNVLRQRKKIAADTRCFCRAFTYSSFAYDVISSHWTPSWLTLQITLAVYSEIVVSIYCFVVSLRVL